MTLADISKAHYTHYNINNYHLLHDTFQKFASKMFFSIETEREIEMGRFTKSHKVHAVMADKSDTFIFEGVNKLWLTGTLFKKDAENDWQIKELNKAALFKMLGISKPDEMALWATLLGNDFLNENYVKSLFKMKGNFKEIAQYIKSVLKKDVKVHDVVDKVAKDLAKASRDEEHAATLAEKIRASLRYYLTEDEPEVDLVTKKRSEEYLGFAFLNKMTISIIEIMEYRKQSDLNRTTEVALYVYKRIAGVFLKGAGKQTRCNILAYAADQYKRIILKPVLPECEYD